VRIFIIIWISVSSLIFARRDCLQQAEKDAFGRTTRPDKDTLAISPSGHFYIHFDTTGNTAPDLTDSNGNGVDFLTIREDFGSVTEIDDDADKDVDGRKYNLEGLLSVKQRTQLIDIFKKFNERREKECPNLHVDFGYAMVALGEGVLGKPLARVNGTQMRKSGFPQLSVAIDSAGDVFLYREAGFLDRPGNDKFIAGRITDGETLESVLKRFIENEESAELVHDDSRFMDSYDHLITLLVNQAEQDMKFKIPFERGPVKVRSSSANELNVKLSNNWYRDEKN